MKDKVFSPIKNSKDILSPKTNRNRHNLSESPESLHSFDSEEKNMRICDIDKIYAEVEQPGTGLKEAIKYKKLGFENENLDLKEELKQKYLTNCKKFEDLD